MPSNNLASRLPKEYIAQRSIPKAVQFGFPSTGDAPKAYPFFYNLIRYPYQQGIADPTTGVYTVIGPNAEGPDGLEIPAGGILNAPVVMDDDANFHLLYMKFGAYRQLYFEDVASSESSIPLQNNQSAPANNTRIKILYNDTGSLNLELTYYVIDSSPTGFNISLTIGGAQVIFTGIIRYLIQDALFGSREYLTYPYTKGRDSNSGALFCPGTDARIPYWSDLDISVYMASSGARDLMGGFQRSPILGATEENPIPLLDVQTADDGLGMIKLPYQLTKSSTINIKFNSRSAFGLRVYGHLFGYKVTV